MALVRLAFKLLRELEETASQCLVSIAILNGSGFGVLAIISVCNWRLTSPRLLIQRLFRLRRLL